MNNEDDKTSGDNALAAREEFAQFSQHVDNLHRLLGPYGANCYLAQWLSASCIQQGLPVSPFLSVAGDSFSLMHIGASSAEITDRALEHIETAFGAEALASMHDGAPVEEEEEVESDDAPVGTPVPESPVVTTTWQSQVGDA